MIKILKRHIRKSKNATIVIAFLYNMLFSHCRMQILLRRFDAKGVFLKGTKVLITGKSNQIRIGLGSSITNSIIIVRGNDCSFELGGGKISNSILYIEDNQSKIKIGNSFTMGSGHIVATEGKSIIICDDCMFSNDIEIRNGDSHPIYDKNNIRINDAKDIKIGKHVWLTAHVRVLKGASIPEGCVIANSCIVTSQLQNPCSIYGGMPIRSLKSDISWRRPRI